MKKVNLGKVGSVLSPLPKTVLVYLAYFVFAEVAISGGRYERDIYLWIVIYALVIVLELVALNRMKKVRDVKTAIFSGLWFALSFVALDYAIVNWLLERNSLSIFKSWETIALYALTLIIPIAKFLFSGSSKKNNQVDELLTNHKPTL